MPLESKQGTPGPIPTANSSAIVGAVVCALRLDDGFLTTLTARRFFQGRSISEDKQAEVFLVLGEALVGRGLVPEPPVFKQHDVSMAAIIGVSIARAASRWDMAVARLQNRSARTVEQGATAERLLRFVVIDMAVRIFAILRLAGMEPDRPGTPLWAQENGGGKLLRELANRARVTREDLATRLGGLSTSSVDNWLDCKVKPNNDSIAAISKVLAESIGGTTPEDLALAIQRQFTFATLADLLAPWIGREKVIELSKALTRFVWLMTEDVRQMDRPPLEEALGLELDSVRLGTLQPEAATLLRNLSLMEPDENWRRGILAATLDWGVLFEAIAAQVNPGRTSAGLAQDIGHVKSRGMPSPA